MPMPEKCMCIGDVLLSNCDKTMHSGDGWENANWIICGLTVTLTQWPFTSKSNHLCAKLLWSWKFGEIPTSGWYVTHRHIHMDNLTTECLQRCSNHRGRTTRQKWCLRKSYHPIWPPVYVKVKCHFTAEIVRVWNSSSSFGHILNIQYFPQLKPVCFATRRLIR